MVCLPDGVSAFSRSCLPLSLLVSPCLPLSPHNIRLCWMACPPSQGLISPCRLPLSPTSLLVSLSWMVCPPFRGLVSLVSTCPPLFPILSHCLPTCVPVLDGVSRPPSRGLVSPSLPLSPLSPIVSPHLCPCWMVRPPFRRLVFPFCLPLSPHMCACVGWGLVLSACVGRLVRLPEVLPPLVSHCLLTMCVCVGWCVRLSKALSPLLSPTSFLVSLAGMVCPPFQGLVSPHLPLFHSLHCLPTGVPVLEGVSAFPRSCLPLSPFLSILVSGCLQ